MFYKRATVMFSVVIVILIGVICIQSKQQNELEYSIKRNYGQQSFGIMMYVAGEINDIVDSYEDEALTEDNLNQFYERMDKYLLSVYNQKPARFIFNLNNIRLGKRHDIGSFNQEVYESYVELSEFLFATYKSMSENNPEEGYLELYNTFIDEDFNANLSQLISNIDTDS